MLTYAGQTRTTVQELFWFPKIFVHADQLRLVSTPILPHRMPYSAARLRDSKAVAPQGGCAYSRRSLQLLAQAYPTGQQLPATIQEPDGRVIGYYTRRSKPQRTNI